MGELDHSPPSFRDGALVLLSQKKRPIQKVAGEVLSESVIGRDSGIGNGGLIWISEHQTAVNRDFRILSRDL
jgi:hypothetical protein